MDELEKIRTAKMKQLLGQSGGKPETKIDVADPDFQMQVVEKSRKAPVVVDFWSPRCGPCLMLGPVLEKLAEGYGGKFILAKANVDECRAMAEKYGIMSIPAVKMFRNGRIVAEFVGAKPEHALRQWLDSNLAPSKGTA